MRLLLVEDDPLASSVLMQRLWADHHVDWVSDGATAEARALAEPYDAILLDLGLPGDSGFDVCRRLRGAGLGTPILIVTARADVTDRVSGLDTGADDYMVKPIDVQELLARLRALTRRACARTARAVVEYGPFSLDPKGRVIRLDGTPLDLSATEFRLLECLLMRAETIVSREQLLAHVWGGALDARSNTPEVYVSYVRSKVPPEWRGVIRTVRGMGYMIKAESVRHG